MPDCLHQHIFIRTVGLILGLFLLVWVGHALSATRGVMLVQDEKGREVLRYGASHALLIGVSDYSRGWPRLPGVEDDLAAVESALHEWGFQVQVVRNPDSAELAHAYQDFVIKHGYGEHNRHNRLLFYFAGHGHTEKSPYAPHDPQQSMGYIVAKDAPLPNEDSVGFLQKALSMHSFEVWAKQLHARHALFIFDSCFSGSVFSLGRDAPADVVRRTARPVRQFITSGTAEQQVPDVSHFRREFIAAIRDGAADRGGDGYVTGTELGYYLQEQVSNYSRNAQTPQYGKIRDPNLDKGDFVFRSGVAVAVARPPPAPSPPPPPVQFLGNVQVNVNVPARVFLDGRPVGQARPGEPVNKTHVSPGQVRVRVEAVGYLPEERGVDVQAGNWAQTVFTLKREVAKVPLTVRSNVHGDTVYVDGRPMGSTRLDVELEPGVHTVRVEKPGYTFFEEQVRLAAGSPKTVRATLRRLQNQEKDQYAGTGTRTQATTAPEWMAGSRRPGDFGAESSTPWLGAQVMDVTPALARAMALPEVEGAAVGGVVEGGPAARAGVRPGDVFVAIDGQPIRGAAELVGTVARQRVGSRITGEIRRGSQKLTVRLTLTPRPALPAYYPPGGLGATGAFFPPDGGGVVTTSEYGLALAEPSAADARDEPGLVVIEVLSGPAAYAGLRPGDVVRSINGLELYDTSDFMDAVESTYSGAPVVLQVERKGRLRLVNLHRAYGPGLTGPGRNSPAEQFDMLRDIQRQYNRNAQDIIDSVGR